jgi:hypothetical protein
MLQTTDRETHLAPEILARPMKTSKLSKTAQMQLAPRISNQLTTTSARNPMARIKMRNKTYNSSRMSSRMTSFPMMVKMTSKAMARPTLRCSSSSRRANLLTICAVSARTSRLYSVRAKTTPPTASRCHALKSMKTWAAFSRSLAARNTPLT